jgi:hypothetical protein
MARREQKLRAQLALPQGLIERSGNDRVPQVSPPRRMRPGSRRTAPAAPSRRSARP